MKNLRDRHEKNIGMRFGSRVIIAIGEPYISPTGRKYGRYVFKCDCCDSERLWLISQVQRNLLTNCRGCKVLDRDKNINQTFGKWTVIGKVKTLGRQLQIPIKCKCGSARMIFLRDFEFVKENAHCQSCSYAKYLKLP